MLSDLPDLPPLSIGDEPSTAPPRAPVALGRPQKAAIVVQLLMRSGVPLSLKNLPEATQAALIHEIGALGNLDPETVAAVADEFADTLENGALTGAAGLAKALDLLDGSISPTIADRLRDTTGIAPSGDPWARIADKSPEDLLPIIERESTEVCAVILTKLKVATAAGILGLLPGARARRLTYAISQIDGVRPDAVARIGHAIARTFDDVDESAFEDGPVERVGAILNFSRSNTRNDVLEGLEETDADFAQEVKKAIFTFANIPERVDPRDIPKIVRQIDQPLLVQALAAANSGFQDAAEFILSGMSKRMADGLREEVEELGEVDEIAGEDAMGAVVAAIRELEEAGEVFLITGDA